MIPPWVVRRLVVTPLVLLLALALILVLPLPVLVAAVGARWLHWRSRALRVATFTLTYAVLETAGILACGVLWVASGFGLRLRTRRFQDAHYALLRCLLAACVRVAETTFRLRVEVNGPAEPPCRPSAGGSRHPLLVLSRHAGPGDSFLLVHHLLKGYGRRPRIVMKHTLQLDPLVDMVGHRLPNAFVRHRPGAEAEMTARVAELAAGLGPDDALVIFPEGGNFSEHRRLRSIRWLERNGHTWEADAARGMTHLIAPRAAGVLAAFGAAPTAHVVMVAHTGLDGLHSVADIWHGIPMERTVTARWWHLAARTLPSGRDARTLPTGRDERTRWLYRWWERLDTWIDDQHRPPVQPRTPPVDNYLTES